MGIPLAALAINQQQPGPLDQASKALQLKALAQQQQYQAQAQPLELQQRQQQVQAQEQAFASEKALRESYAKAVQPDEKGQPQINTDVLQQALASAGHGDLIPGVLENINKFQEGKNKLTESAQKIQEGAADVNGYAAKAIQDAKYDPHLAHTVLDTMGNSPQVQQLRQMIDGDPNTFKQHVDAAVSASPALRKMANEQEVAKIRAGGTGEQPLGDKVPQINQALAGRYQVLNPGKPLPQELTLPANATSKDFDRIDKIMQQTEQAKQSQSNAEATQSQRGLTNAIAQQGLDLRKQADARKDEDFVDKNYVKPANDAEKSYQMFQNAYANRNNAKTGAESMLALSTHLATTFGNVKGSRITKDMIHEHLGARSIGDSALAAIQKLTNGDVLSPDQWDAFKGLITESRNLGWQTAKKEATRRNVDITGSLPTDLKTGAGGEAPGSHPFFSQFGGSVKQ